MVRGQDIAPEVPRLLRREEYERMVALGMFEGERVELLYGVIVSTSPHGPEHDSAVERLTSLLVRALHPRASVRIQSAFAASDGSEPEPDVAVVPPGDYRRAHPSKAHLVVEVAGSSLTKDRGLKARLYAESGVEEYWVVDLTHELLVVHSDIVDGAYARVVSLRRGERARLLRFPDVEVSVSEILG